MLPVSKVMDVGEKEAMVVLQELELGLGEGEGDNSAETADGCEGDNCEDGGAAGDVVRGAAAAGGGARCIAERCRARRAARAS